MVKILEINDGWMSRENCHCHVLSSDNNLSKIKFKSWKSLEGIFPDDVIVDISNSDKPTDIFYHALKLFVSYKIAQIILKHDTKLVEIFPVNVIWNGDEYTETSFFLMNIMDKIDCIDRERSEYTIDKYIDNDDNSAFMSEISKLAIRPIDENTHKIFFIANIFGTSLELAVSDDVAQDILSQNCNGCELIDISSYKR